MYIVRNLTNRPVVLSDIRAEIGPHRIIDLENAVSRDNVERSNDLKQALLSKKLQFVKQTVIRAPVIHTEQKVIEKTVEIHKSDFDENKLKEIVRSVMKEELNAANPQNIDDTVQKAMSSGMSKVLDTLRDKLNSINIQTPASTPGYIDVPVDPGKLAEMQQRVVDNLSKDIDSNKIKQGKKIKLIDSNISDRAKEL